MNSGSKGGHGGLRVVKEQEEATSSLPGGFLQRKGAFLQGSCDPGPGYRAQRAAQVGFQPLSPPRAVNSLHDYHKDSDGKAAKKAEQAH